MDIKKGSVVKGKTDEGKIVKGTVYKVNNKQGFCRIDSKGHKYRIDLDDVIGSGGGKKGKKKKDKSDKDVKGQKRLGKKKRDKDVDADATKSKKGKKKGKKKANADVTEDKKEKKKGKKGKKGKGEGKDSGGKKKAAFGGYAISFKGHEQTTLGEIFGKKPVPPSEMTKKLWAYVKKNDLGGK